MCCPGKRKQHRAWCLNRTPTCATEGWGRGAGRLQINVSVTREILNHRMLVHPHIIRFREVLL